MNDGIVAPHKNLKLSANLIAVVAPFMAKNDIRYYLKGINIRPHKNGGAVICATNGHALGAVYDPTAVCEAEVTLIVDARTAAACRAKSTSKRSLVIVNNRLTVVELKIGEVCIQAGNPVIECKYPNYATVIPAAEKLVPGLVGSFDREYIHLVEVAAQACGKVASSRIKSIGVQFFSVGGDHNACAVARVESLPEFVGVLMPRRAETLLSPMPEWVGLTPPTDDLDAMKAAA